MTFFAEMLHIALPKDTRTQHSYYLLGYLFTVGGVAQW